MKDRPDVLFLFSHYGSWDWVHQNYQSLVQCEGVENVIPISEDNHGLPGTCILRKYGNLFGFDGQDKHYFCDAMLYHWVINNKKLMKGRRMIFLIESDVFWGIPHAEWSKEIEYCDNCALACDFRKVYYPPHEHHLWDWFKPHKNHPHYKDMFGMIIGSIVGFDVNLIQRMANKFRDENIWWSVGINELRMGTLANLCGAEFVKLPQKVCGYNQFGLWDVHRYKGEGIFHPVKYVDKDLKLRRKS